MLEAEYRHPEESLAERYDDQAHRVFLRKPL